MALDVLICVLDRSYAQNNDQRKYDQARRDGRELGDELEDGDESEKSTRIVSKGQARETELHTH